MTTKPKPTSPPLSTIAKVLGLEDGASEAAIVTALEDLTKAAEVKAKELADLKAELDERGTALDAAEKAVAVRERAVTDQEKALDETASKKTAEFQKRQDELDARAKTIETREAELDAAGNDGDTPKPEAPEPNTPADGKIRVRVIGPKSGRWRGGRHYGPDTSPVDLTEDELTAVKADPKLSVTEV